MPNLPIDEDSPFLAFVGIDDVKSEDGEGSVTLVVNRHHLQAAGRVHGGLISVLADTAGYRAIRSILLPGQTTTTVELKINFLEGAPAGTLTATARVIGRDGPLVITEMEVTDQDSRLIAQALSTYIIIETTGREMTAGQ